MKRINEKMEWYWPEIHKYCGCCNLRTGIYIRTIISMIINLTSLLSNCGVLYYMIYTSPHFTKSSITEIDMFETLLEIPDLPETQKNKMILTFKILIGYYIAWVIMKAVYVVLLVFVIYGIYKRKARILKVFLYIVIPYWIFDVIISSLGAIVSNFWLKFVLVIALLSEGYNLLAINTEYKILKGKSMIYLESSSIDIETMTAYENGAPAVSMNNNYQVQNQQLHCRTCTCQTQYTNVQPEISNETHSTGAPENATSSEKERLPSLNFKDTAIIFDQSQLIDSDTAFLTECRNRALERSIVDQDDSNKKKMTDEPVIYDDSQLKVGTSSVIEDR